MGSYLFIAFITVAGLLISYSQKGVFQRVITTGLALSILALAFNSRELLTASIYLQLAMALATVVFGFLASGLKRSGKIALVITGLYFICYHLFILAQWPGVNFVILAAILPVVLFAVMLYGNREKQHSSFGFMVIWISQALAEFIPAFFW